ncbi:rubrerythrin-like domain-containing protein [Halosimplex sp. J119]
MLSEDPYTAKKSRYECRDCLNRVTTDGTISSCPDCGGRMRNVAVPRE